MKGLQVKNDVTNLKNLLNFRGPIKVGSPGNLPSKPPPPIGDFDGQGRKAGKVMTTDHHDCKLWECYFTPWKC